MTRTGDYLAKFRARYIDQRMKSFNHNELVISFELGVMGGRINDPDALVRLSLAHAHELRHTFH